MSASLFDKLWLSHEILQRDDGTSLLWVDRHFVHEGSHHAFARLAQRNARVAHPELTFAVADHYAPTHNRLHIVDATVARMINTLADNAAQHGIELIGLNDPRQGIVHVIGPELGLTLPGLLINCGDSHTSTHGAFGTLAFGIGATEVAHVLSTQTLWQKKPRSMRLVFDGTLSAGVTAKDLALYWIARLGNGAAAGHAIEYSGSAITSLSMDARMTLCNLSIEGGARLGMIAPDQKTSDYIRAELDRAKEHGTQHYAPENIDSAAEYWKLLYSDVGAVFDREIHFDAAKVAPVVSWGISPAQSVAVTDCLPDPAEQELTAAHATRSALDYMGLAAGQSLEGLPIDQVFLGSCTNGRLEDIRAAATVLKGHRAKVPGLVSPGSSVIKKQAEDEGLDQIFIEAGLTWAESGCSLCVGMNGDTVAAGKRCASTTNRNFRGRQGQGSRTHLMSPAMVAAAAVHGRIVDVRSMAVAGELQP